jgi:putative flippase GtrA
LGLETEVSKGIGFSSGALFAYFANRRFTFNSSTKGFFAFSLFWVLYITTLTVNIVTNELSLSIFGEEGFGIGLSLFIATGLSALLNYFGMKYVVFRSC